MPVTKQQPTSSLHHKEVRFNAEKLRKVHGRCAAAAFAMAEKGNSWDKLFRALDRNHDRRLDQAEFVQACREQLDLTEDTFPKDIIESVFRLLDEDGGGHLDVQVSIPWLLTWMCLGSRAYSTALGVPRGAEEGLAAFSLHGLCRSLCGS